MEGKQNLLRSTSSTSFSELAIARGRPCSSVWRFSIEEPAHKLNDRWRGPFRIVEKSENSTFYRLEELDGTPLSGTAAGDRVKKFYMRRELEEILWEDDIRGSKETLTNNVAGEDLDEEELVDEEPVQSDGDEQAGLEPSPIPIVIKRWTRDRRRLQSGLW